MTDIRKNGMVNHRRCDRPPDQKKRSNKRVDRSTAVTPEADCREYIVPNASLASTVTVKQISESQKVDAGRCLVMVGRC